jgi:PAS domain S-box-containing protein
MPDTGNQEGYEASRDSSLPEEIHRFLFAESVDGIFITDLQGRFMAVNPRGTELTGYPREELLDLTVTDLIPPEDLSREPLRLDELRQGKTVVQERRFRRKDGSLLPVEVSVRMLPEGNLMGLVRDITERQQAEEALRYREALERLVTGISSRFINLAPGESEEAINQALEAIGKFTGADRSYLFFFRDGGTKGDNTHEWCAEGIESQRDRLQGLSLEDFRLFSEPLLRSEVVYLPRLADLPHEAAAEKRELDLEGIQSLLLVPIEFGKIVVGFLGLDAVRGEKSWAPDIIALLRIVGEVLASALERQQAEASLLRSEERLRLALEAADQGLYDLNVQTGEAEVTPEYATMLGYDPAEFHETNAAWIERLHPEDHEPVAAVYRDYIAGKIPEYRVEFRQRTRSGAWKWILSLGRVVERDAQGQPLRMLGTHTDITERKRMEETLREREERFRLLIQNSSDIITIVDEKGWQRFDGGPLERILGYQASELAGTSGFDLVHPEDRQETIRVFTEGVKQPGAIGSLEYRCRYKDGHWVTLEAVGTNLLLDPHVKGVVLNIRDISDRKRAEEELKTRTEDLDRFFTVALDLLCIADTDGYFRRLNPQWEAVLGYPMAELEGRRFLDLVHPEDLEATLGAVARLADQEAVLDFTNRYRCRDGSYRWIEWRSYPAGRLIYAAARDITERKKAEAEREKLQVQLYQAQKMESVGRLAGGVAHDFNNMLSAILGHAELAMMRCPPSEPLQDDLQAIQKAGLRSADLVRQLLAFARKQTVAPKVLDLNDTVAGMLKMLRRLIGEDIDLVWIPGRDLWPVKMDPSQVDQLLANLCLNARDAITGVGQVTIETDNIAIDEAYGAVHPGFACGEYVLLAVSDDGCGMTPESWITSSNRSSPPRKWARAQDWGWPRCTASSSKTRGSSTSTANPAKGPPSRSTCPGSWAKPWRRRPKARRPRRPKAAGRRCCWWRTRRRSWTWAGSCWKGWAIRC